ncbi:MAG: hypothetical protein ACLP5H_29670, partial [Desulfomonilaceae bacterium]
PYYESCQDTMGKPTRYRARRKPGTEPKSTILPSTGGLPLDDYIVTHQNLDQFLGVRPVLARLTVMP